MGSTELSAQHGPLDLARDRIGLKAIRWSRAFLLVSMAMLASAPLFISDTYSPLQHTISESGAQGVAGAWIQRSGVVLAAAAVFVMTFCAGTWGRSAKRWIQVYSFALVMLAVFPESPWDGGSHDAMVARLHSVAGVIAAIAFVVGVLAVSTAGHRGRWARVLDGSMVAAVVLIPQLMLLWPFDGILQRAMVALGYAWLLVECHRMLLPRPDAAPAPPPDL